MQHTIECQQHDKTMQHTIKYQHNDKTMQHTIKYQQNNKPHASHNQLHRKSMQPMHTTINIGELSLKIIQQTIFYSRRNGAKEEKSIIFKPA